jgi:hypothetical protein
MVAFDATGGIQTGIICTVASIIFICVAAALIRWIKKRIQTRRSENFRAPVIAAIHFNRYPRLPHPRSPATTLVFQNPDNQSSPDLELKDIARPEPIHYSIKPIHCV